VGKAVKKPLVYAPIPLGAALFDGLFQAVSHLLTFPLSERFYRFYRFSIGARTVVVNSGSTDYNEGNMPSSDKPYLNFVIEPRLLNRVDDFRYKHRFPTRAAAIKWLLAWALDQKPVPKVEK
jgi:hypothetical protein